MFLSPSPWNPARTGCPLPSGYIKITIENGRHLELIYPLKMGMVHSCVSLPEGNHSQPRLAMELIHEILAKFGALKDCWVKLLTEKSPGDSLHFQGTGVALSEVTPGVMDAVMTTL